MAIDRAKSARVDRHFRSIEDYQRRSESHQADSTDGSDIKPWGLRALKLLEYASVSGCEASLICSKIVIGHERRTLSIESEFTSLRLSFGSASVHTAVQY
jgi:hypothetical protein